MIMTATVMLESMDYSEENNLRICIPYLEYYSVLYSMRSFVLTLASQGWNDGQLINHTHKKTINIACDVLKELDKELGERTKNEVLGLKAFRELISYRAPSSGDSNRRLTVDVILICKVFVELAQMMSELLEKSMLKRIKDSEQFLLKDEILKVAYHSDIDGIGFYDDEDKFRIDYFKRKYPIPANIMHMISDGHAEDFFGSWCADEDVEGIFSPDENWRKIFDVP